MKFFGCGKRQQNNGNISSSPLLANGKMYIGSRDGKMVVISCDENLQTLHEYDFWFTHLHKPMPGR